MPVADFARTNDKTRRALGMLSVFLAATVADASVPAYAEGATLRTHTHTDTHTHRHTDSVC